MKRNSLNSFLILIFSLSVLNISIKAATQLNISGPAGSGAFGTTVKTLPNGNVVVVDPLYDIPNSVPIRDVGAVYLYDGKTGALISTLTGSKMDDKIGQNGITILANGNYLILSPSWDNGSVQNAGAITYGNAETGVSGVVSLSNSLTSHNSDSIGYTAVKMLSGNRVLLFNTGWFGSRGAVTFFSGTNFPTGLISESNSLVGGNNSDRVGTGINGTIDTTELPNGNYVVISSSWNTLRGAVTLCPAANGCVGTVSTANSLTGSVTSDSVGVNGITVLPNGNYVVKSRGWYNGNVRNAGAVTFCNATTGTVGEVSPANSLVGSFQSDGLGNVTVLTNSNYVVHSSNWNGYRGSATFGSGISGVSGVISSANSLVGTNEFDQVSDNGVIPLTNGNYVVSSPTWGNSRGAITWGNGSTGIAGEISQANSFTAQTRENHVGMYTQTKDVYALPNGNYVIRSLWGTSGAITVGNGTTGLAGFIAESNSLYGKPSDQVGSGGITILPNGYFIISSPYWDNGNIYNAGAITISSPNGIVGEVSPANSLVGSHDSDSLGDSTSGIYIISGEKVAITTNRWNSNRGAVTFINNFSTAVGALSETNSIVGVNSDDLAYSSVRVLRSGNCLMSSTNWNSGRGAVTFIPNCSNAVGTISESTSLVGNASGGGIGYTMELPNGNVIIPSVSWNNYRGSITFVNQFTGMPVGFISESNSLVGTTPDDFIGGVSNGSDGITFLPNGNIIVRSPKWDNGSIVDAGALMIISGSTATTGTINSANSLVGNSASDAVGGNLTVFQDGNFAARTSGWDNGSINNAGAVTFGNTNRPPRGNITAENSVFGTAANGGVNLTYDYSPVRKNLVVGRPNSNLITFFQAQSARSFFDFDGDSKTDIGIFRPSTGAWWINASSNNVTTALGFGSSEDKLIPADYTGDGKTDVAFFRPSTGQWFVLRSENYSFYGFQFGAAGDIPVPGDFDGDGKADAAVFRPSNSGWYIMRSSDGGVTAQAFGTSEDKPVVADYDGDGKDDLAIFRPSTGAWWIQRSSNNSVLAIQFGSSTDKTVQGDYTGDGKADIAFFRPSNGSWYILRSEDFSFYGFTFGAGEDLPAPGDYDGDGKFDAGVFRPSNSSWYLLRSSGGFIGVAFGTTGDQPIPNAFVR